MATVVKFTRPNNLGYYCDKPDDQSGEYVPLAEYQQLIAEVERLRAEVERLTLREPQDTASPKPGPLPVMKPGPSTSSGHGFLAWVMQVEDALPPGMARGVNVEELRRWFEAGMTVEGAALRLAQEGPERVRDDTTR